MLARDGFDALAHSRVGLITNHTGLDRDGSGTVDLFLASESFELVALFSPRVRRRNRARG